MLSSAPFRVALISLVAQASSCDFRPPPPPPPPTSQKFVLYQIGELRFLTSVSYSYLLSDELDKRRSVGYELFGRGDYDESWDCFKSLFGTEHDLDAKLMCGIIDVKRGKISNAYENLNAARDDHSGHYKFWPYKDDTWANMAVVWWLLQLEDSKAFESAEKTALSIAQLNGDDFCWSLLKEVRSQKQAHEDSVALGRTAINICLIITLGLLIAFCSRRALGNKILVAELRRDLNQEMSGKFLSPEIIQAQLIAKIAELNAASFLSSKQFDITLEGCRSSMDIVNQLAIGYQQAINKINNTNISDADKRLYQRELGAKLKEMVSSLTVNS